MTPGWPAPRRFWRRLKKSWRPGWPTRPARPPDENAFAWREAEHPAARAMADDALDTVRGLMLKTSGGYEMFIAEQPLSVLMIPRGVYLREWYSAHSPETFLAALETPDAL